MLATGLGLNPSVAYIIRFLSDIVISGFIYDAVKFALKGETGKMVSMQRVSNNPYKISYTCIDLDEIANKVKEFPSSWIINNNDISDEFINYALPLIQGEIKNKFKRK